MEVSMHRQFEVFGSISWIWPAVIIFLVLLAIGLVAYAVIRNRKHEDSSDRIIKEEEEMAEIWCPNLLTEIQQLRAEVRRFKGSEPQRTNLISRNS
jgi:hypothetical protein